MIWTISFWITADDVEAKFKEKIGEKRRKNVTKTLRFVYKVTRLLCRDTVFLKITRNLLNVKIVRWEMFKIWSKFFHQLWHFCTVLFAFFCFFVDIIYFPKHTYSLSTKKDVLNASKKKIANCFVENYHIVARFCFAARVSSPKVCVIFRKQWK